jgi:hypothetical protein
MLRGLEELEDLVREARGEELGGQD